MKLDQSIVGTKLSPVQTRVDGWRLKFFLKAIGEEPTPVASTPWEDAQLPIPPTYLFCLGMLDARDPFEVLTRLSIPVASVLHGEQAFEYYAPVCVGDALLLESKITGVADKKDGALVFLEVTTRVTNQHEVHVADEVRTIVIRNADEETANVS